MVSILKEKKMYSAFVSKHNLNCKKQVILLMIPNKEGWHYLVGKELPALLREITSKHHCDFYCLNCLYSFAAEKQRESHKKVNENKNLCNVGTSFQDIKSIRI